MAVAGRGVVVAADRRVAGEGGVGRGERAVAVEDAAAHAERAGPVGLPVADPLEGDGGFERYDGVLASRPMRDSTAMEIEVDPNADAQVVMREIINDQPLRGIELRRLSLDDLRAELARIYETESFGSIEPGSTSTATMPRVNEDDLRT
mgnify:CR=1 FL=1